MAKTVNRLTDLKVKKAGIGLHADGDGLYLQASGEQARSWLYRYRERFRVTLALSKEMYRWRGQKCEPWAIWMGAEEHAKWRLESSPDQGPEEFRDVPVRLTQHPAFTFCPYRKRRLVPEVRTILQ